MSKLKYSVEDSPDARTFPKKPPQIPEDGAESSPILLKASQKLRLSNILLSPNKLPEPQQNVHNPLPIRIQYKPLQNPPAKISYQRVSFDYNSDIEKIRDFNGFDWNMFKTSDFLSFLHFSKQTPRDYLKFAKNNHKDPNFLQNIGNNSDKLLEIAYFDSDSGPISHLIFTGDRKLIISVSAQDFLIKVWDSNEFRLRGTLEGFEDAITCVYACFRSDTLLTCSLDCKIIVWDLDKMEETRRIENVHHEEITKIEMNNEENRLFTASKDGFLKILDWKTLKVLRVFEALNKKSILDFCFSGDERFLIFCGQERKIHVFDKSKDPLYIPAFSLLSSNFQGFSQVSFFDLDNRKKILSLAEDGSIILWDFDLGIQEKTLVAHVHQIYKFRVLPETNQIISINRQNTIQLWNIRNGKELIRKKAQGTITDFALFRKRQENNSIYKFQMVTSSAESQITIWGVAEINNFNKIHQYHAPISHCLSTLDNKYVIFSSQNTINILDLSTNRIEKQLFSHTGPITSLLLSPDSKSLISGSGSNDFSIKIWDLDAGLGEETLKKHQSEVIFIGLSPDFSHLISGATDQTLVLWDFKKKKEKSELKNIGLMKKVAFSSSSEFFTGGKEGTIKHWKIDPLEEIRAFSAHSGEITGMEHVKSSNELLSGSVDGTIKIWSSSKGGEVLLERIIENNEDILSFIITFDEKNVVLIDDSRKAKSYCLETTFLEETFDFSVKTEEKIGVLNAFMDGRKIVLGGEGGGLYLWEYRDPKYSEGFLLNELLENINNNEELWGLCEKFMWKSTFASYIYPCKASFLHYLAYNGEPEKIRRIFEVLAENKDLELVFQKDLFGNTVFDILFDQRDITTVFYLLNLASEYIPKLHHFANITEVIRKVARLKFRNLPKLLDSRLLTIEKNDKKRLKNRVRLFFPSAFFIGKKVNFLESSAVLQPEELLAKRLLIAPSEGEPVYSAKIQILDIPDVLKEDGKNNIFEGLAQNQGILESEAMKLLVGHKWEKYAEGRYHSRIVYYFFILLMLVVYSVWLLPLRVRFISDFSRVTRYGLVNLIFLCFLSFFILIYLVSEAWKFVRLGPKSYFRYIKNWYFLLSLSLFTVTLIFDWCGLYNIYFDEDLIRNLHAFNLYFFTLGFLFFLKPFQSFSFGRLFFKVLNNIKVFILLLVLFIYNFGFIIWILDESWSFAYNSSDENTITYWKEPFETFNLVYRIMIRDFDSFDHEPKPLYMIVLWVFFLITTFLLIVVMVNIFIAVVFEMEQELRRNKEGALLKERCEIVLETDKLCLKQKFNKYFFVSEIYEGETAKKRTREIKNDDASNQDLLKFEEKIMERLGQIEKKIAFKY